MTEFALCAPVLLILLLGSIEGSRFLLVNQKQEKIAFTVADVVAQSTDLTTAGMDQLLAATQDMMNPYTFGANGIVMVTSVTKNPGQNPIVNWRYTGGGTLAGSSSLIGNVGSTATLPTGFTLNDRDNIIIAEVFYRFTPLFNSKLFGSRTLYKSAIYKPRLGELTNAPS
ncbi:MAG: TadE/TadG family type IV pilus assembly protein [Rickettsiales bacterium]